MQTPEFTLRAQERIAELSATLLQERPVEVPEAQRELTTTNTAITNHHMHQCNYHHHHHCHYVYRDYCHYHCHYSNHYHYYRSWFF